MMANQSVALLIVDVQNGFINEHTKHLPPLIEELQNSYKHVFAAKFVNPLDSQYRRWLGWSRFTPGSDEIDLAFKVGDHVKVFEKNIFTCVNAQFLAQLEDCNVEQVDICGVDTDVCVTKIATDLFENGRFRPVVLSRYCASHYGEAYHRKGLEVVGRYIGAVHVKS